MPVATLARILELASWVLALCLTLFLLLALQVWRSRLEKLFPAWSLNLALLCLGIWEGLLFLSFLFLNDFLIPPPLPEFLWHWNMEFSTASVVSTIPFFLAGILCLAIILPSGKLSTSEWLYWFLLCLVFITMALLEFKVSPRNLFFIPRGIYITGAAGGLVAGSTLVMILRSKSTRYRQLLFVLLLGLVLWAIGVEFLDKIRIGRIYIVNPLEETLELAGSLIALSGIAGYASLVAPAVRTQRTILAACGLLFFFLPGAVIHYRFIKSVHYENWDLPSIVRSTLEERLYASPLNVTIDDTLALTGWHYDIPPPGNAATLHLWLHATRWAKNHFGLNVQLRDQESESVLASIDKMSWDGTEIGPVKRKWPPGRVYTRTQAVDLTLPADTHTNRALALVLSFWEYDRQAAVRPLPVTHSDRPLLADTHIILDEFVLPDPVASAVPDDALARFGNGFALQAASIPERAQAGAELEVVFRWGSDSAGSEDWTQFLHLVHEESGSLWNVDQMPLGLRLPTRLWYAGLQASEAWRFTLPADLQPGQYAIYSGLYRLSDMQRLGVTLADGAQPADARILLGTILIEG